VTGKILYKAIQIESGGRISGDIQVSEEPEPAQMAEPAEPAETQESAPEAIASDKSKDSTGERKAG
jgi:cytoskeletal protein CcmA (bactofilin family)